MLEKTRRLVARVLLVTATFVAVMGYNFTRNPAFVALPFLAGIALFVVVRKRPMEVPACEEGKIRKWRRQGTAQLLVSGLMITGFIVYRSVEGDWGMALGFALMLATLAPLAVLAYLFYTRAPLERPEKKHTGGKPSSCDELKHAGRLYAGEELTIKGPAAGEPDERAAPGD